MATPAQTLITKAAADGFFALSRRDLQECTLYAIALTPTAGTPAKTLLAGAYSKGYDKVDTKLLDQSILAAATGNP